MPSSWWMLIRSRLPDPVGGFVLTGEVHQQVHFRRSLRLNNNGFRCVRTVYNFHL